MRVLGIIAEYNPFHNGHRYHLEQSVSLTGADCAVAVMSGNFLQRGEPAMWDKRVRARAAVENGVNLVLELPFAFACNNAEQFAYGGVALLSRLGCVTDLAFGCEGDFEELQQTARLLAFEDEGFRQELSAALDQGMSFPAARTRALSACGSKAGAELLTLPNNILAAEYMKQCILQKATIRLWGIRRMDGGYNSTKLCSNKSAAGEGSCAGAMASARAIRTQWMKEGEAKTILPFIPEQTAAVLNSGEGCLVTACNDFFSVLAARLRTMPAEELAQIWAVTEGLENLMKRAVLRAGNMDELLDGIKSKRYTRTRIQRALTQALMGLSRQDFEQILRQRLLYAQVLAFDEKGAKLLRHMKKTDCAKLSVYSNLSKEIIPDAPEQLLLKYDLLATDLYHLVRKQEIYCNSDLVSAPYYKKRWIF